MSFLLFPKEPPFLIAWLSSFDLSFLENGEFGLKCVYFMISAKFLYAVALYFLNDVGVYLFVFLNNINCLY